MIRSLFPEIFNLLRYMLNNKNANLIVVEGSCHPSLTLTKLELCVHYMISNKICIRYNMKV